MPSPAAHAYADRFQILELAGRGGMGTIHRARDVETGAPVALKVLDDAGGEAAARFLQEAALLAELAHPAIVAYVAHGTTAAGEHYLAMEWLEGETLEERLGRGPLNALESARLGQRALAALGFAHGRGVIHRDVKPANLFLPGHDPAAAKLLDFGIARRAQELRRLTATGHALGTPMYVSPEQARGDKQLDGRADIFALGCVLYECLTGQPPFTGETAGAVLARICVEEAPDLRARCPQAPGALVELIAAMLVKDPARRAGPADALADALAVIAGELASGAAAPPALLRAGEQRVLAVVMAGPANAPADDVAAARRALEPFGARLEPQPDGALVATLSGRGAPIDQAVQAARAALALRAVLPARALAVSTARGVVRGAGPVGVGLDGILPLLAGAVAGTITADEDTAALLDARFTFAASAGVPGRLLLGEKRNREAPRTVLGRELPCLGRDRELHRLEVLFDQVVAEPAAHAALITAAPGGGKSRVRFELCARIEARGAPGLRLVGHGDELRAGAPLHLLGSALRGAAGLGDHVRPAIAQRRVLDFVGESVASRRAPLVAAFLGELCGVQFPATDLPALAAARSDPRLMADQLRAAWLEWLEAECRRRPVLLVLEDLHWGDGPSVELVDAALRALADRPLFVLACARPEVERIFPGLWQGRPLVRIALPPLTSKACQRLARQVLEDLGEERAAWLVERADGNPFVLEELLRAVAAGARPGAGVVLPHTVLGMVQARFDALGSEARRLLSAASVFGRTFPAAGAAALHGPGAAAWLDALTTHEVIFPRPAPDEGAYEFRHALVRDAAYDLLPAEDRRRAHLGAGTWLEQAGEHTAILLVEHFERGGDQARAARWCPPAAAQALDANDLAAAVARAERGLRCGASGGVRAELRLTEARARFWRGEYAEAELAAREAFALGDGIGRLAAAAELAAALGQQARYDDVESLLAQVMATPPEAAAHAAHTACALRAADFLAAGGRYEIAERTLRELARGGPALPPTLAARARELEAKLACHAGDQAAGVLGFQAALAAFEAAGDARSACESLSNVGVTLGELGALDEAEAHLVAALATAQRLDLRFVSAAVLVNLAFVRAHAGRIAEARLAAERALGLARAQGDRRFEGAALLALAMSGDVGAARDEGLEEALSHATAAVAALRPVPPALPLALAVRARALLAAGRPADALVEARAAHELLERLGRVEDGEACVRLVYAETLAACGQTAEAAAALARAAGRLQERAAAITSPAWRASFLARLPDHARTLALATSSASSGSALRS